MESAASGPSSMDDGITSNTIRMYHAFDESMMKAHNAGERAKAEETARMLITYSDLPLVFRARACMILGLSTEPGYVEWAKESVRVMELGIAHIPGGGPPREATQTLLEACQEALRWAEQDYQEQGGYGEQDEAADDISDSASADVDVDSAAAGAKATAASENVDAAQKRLSDFSVSAEEPDSEMVDEGQDDGSEFAGFDDDDEMLLGPGEGEKGTAAGLDDDDDDEDEMLIGSDVGERGTATGIDDDDDDDMLLGSDEGGLEIARKMPAKKPKDGKTRRIDSGYIEQEYDEESGTWVEVNMLDKSTQDQPKKKKKVRRIASATDRVLEYDEETGEWVDMGPREDAGGSLFTRL